MFAEVVEANDAGPRPASRLPIGTILPLQVEGISDPSREFINDLLGEHNKYPEEGSLHQYIQSRMDLISDGEIPVIIIHGDEKNALATTDCVIVFDGILKELEYEEELDGLLAHEAIHIREGHVEAITATSGRLDRLGKTRLSEAEADLRATELLDSKGINPKGLSSLLDKLGSLSDVNAAAKRSTSRPVDDSFSYNPVKHAFEDDGEAYVGDVHHGSPRDRKLNFEESLWFVDSRNASNELTTLSISDNDYEAHEDDGQLLKRYDELSPTDQALLLTRQRPANPRRAKRVMEVDEVERRFEVLLQDQIPELSESKVKAAAQHLTRANIPESTEKLSAEEIYDLADSLQQPVLADLGIKPTSYELTAILVEELTQYLDRPGVELSDYISLAESITAMDPKLSKVQWKPLLRRLANGVDMDQQAAREIGDYLSRTDAPLIDIQSSLSNQISGSESLLVNSVILQEAENKRLQTAQAIKDPVELFKYLARYSFAVGEKRPLRFRQPFDGEEADPQRIGPEYLNWGTFSRLYVRGEKPTVDSARSLPADADEDEPAPENIPAMEGFGSINKAVENSSGNGPKLYGEPAIQITIDSVLTSYSIQRITKRIAGEKTADPDADINYARRIYDWFLGTDQKLEDKIKLAATFANKKELVWAFDDYFKALTIDSDNTEDDIDLMKFIEDEEDYLQMTRDGIPSFKKLLRIAESLQKITAGIEATGINDGISVQPEDLVSCNMFLRIVLDSCLKATGTNEIAGDKVAYHFRSSSAVLDLLKNIPITRLGGSNTNEVRYMQSRENWSNLVTKAFENGGPKTIDELLTVAALGLMAENVQVNLQVPAAAIKAAVEMMPFDEGCELVFETLAHQPPYITSAAVEYLVEEKAGTIEEFEVLDKYMRDSIERLLSHTTLAGKLAIADGLLIENYAQLRARERQRGIVRDDIKGLESTRLLKAMLESGLNDAELKNYMFERWWLRYRLGDMADESIAKFFKLEDLVMYQKPSQGKQSQRSYWLRGVPVSDKYKPLTAIMQEVYTAGGLAKYYALRKLLIGEKAGVLNSEDGRASLLEAFSQSWLDMEADGQAEATLQQILQSLFEAGESEELYQRLSPILMELTLRPPQQPAAWEPIITAKAAKEMEGLLKRDVIFEPKTPQEAERDMQMLRIKITNLLAGGGKDARKVKRPEQLLLAWSRDKKVEYAKERFTPLGMAIVTGKKLGALGVRMLQLAGQYFPLNPDEKEQIADVYDNMRGQSRIQAYRVLKREAQYSSEVAELLEDAATIEPRIGGGSLMTVYKVIKKDGSEEAVAIKNPNAEYHLESVVRLMDKTLADANERDPSNTTYTFMQGMLTDSTQWILDELRDPDFAAKDVRFRADNDTRVGDFDKGGSRYDILVPESRATNTTWVRRDEFIDGKNLTGLKITNGQTDIAKGVISSADYKSAVSLLTRNYVHQLTNTGLAHSDIHPGNFRITSDNKSIAVFDRHNLLRLSGPERRLCKQVVLSLASGSPAGAVDLMADYLLELPENSGLLENREKLLEDIRQGLQSGQQSLVDTLVTIKRNNVKVPLKLSLIIKNMLSLEEISKVAGFSSIGEAFLSTATEKEVSGLLS